MALRTDQRRLLGTFLRAHREHLTALAAGLHESRAERRRTPGLRREEVAQLCGMSPTWYTWIEQGRDVSVSAPALARLADALRLSAAERGYLFELAQKRDPAAVAEEPEPSSELARALQPALDAIQTPAYLLDRLWRAQAWNAGAALLFSDWLAGADRCLLAYVFLDPRARGFIPDWENRARRLVAEFRADTARGPEDAQLRALIERLQEASSPFQTFWSDHAVSAREGGTRLFDHPRDGRVSYEQITLVPAGWPAYKLVVLVPGINAPREGSSAG